MVPYMLQVHCTDNEVSYRLDVDTWFRRWRFHIKRHNIDPFPSPDGTIWNRQRNNEKHDDALLNCDVHRFRTKSNAVFINRYLVFWLFSVVALGISLVSNWISFTAALSAIDTSVLSDTLRPYISGTASKPISISMNGSWT